MIERQIERLNEENARLWRELKQRDQVLAALLLFHGGTVKIPEQALRAADTKKLSVFHDPYHRCLEMTYHLEESEDGQADEKRAALPDMRG